MSDQTLFTLTLRCVYTSTPFPRTTIHLPTKIKFKFIFRYIDVCYMISMLTLDMLTPRIDCLVCKLANYVFIYFKTYLDAQ